MPVGVQEYLHEVHPSIVPLEELPEKFLKKYYETAKELHQAVSRGLLTARPSAPDVRVPKNLDAWLTALESVHKGSPSRYRGTLLETVRESTLGKDEMEVHHAFFEENSHLERAATNLAMTYEIEKTLRRLAHHHLSTDNPDYESDTALFGETRQRMDAVDSQEA